MEAKKLYADRKRDIDALLGLIGQEVTQHAEYARKEGGPNWAHCGDLGYVREHLMETLAFLANQDVEFVAETLDDIAAGREQANGKTTS